MRARAVVLLAVAVLAGGCGGGGGPKTLTYSERAAPFSFTYPKAFISVFSGAGGREIRGRPPFAKVTLGTDDTNVLVVSAYHLKKAAESYPPDLFALDVNRAAAAIARGSGQKITRSSRGKLGPLPGYVYELATADGGLRTRFVLAFRGRIEYFLRCQWDAAGARTVPGACNAAQTSFRERSPGAGV
jgi:hypothetical protein